MLEAGFIPLVNIVFYVTSVQLLVWPGHGDLLLHRGGFGVVWEFKAVITVFLCPTFGLDSCPSRRDAEGLMAPVAGQA